jgi:CubicO group peptidase (beta-lactamase class C family)
MRLEKTLLRTALSTLLLTATLLSLRAAEIPGATPEDVGMSSAKLAKVDDVFNGFVAKKRLAGGIVIIARKGKIVHFESYGLADLKSKRPMGKDEILRFYSMSKAITSAAAMILVDEGKLDLEAPVSKYLPEMKRLKVATGDGLVEPTRELTTADLLRHTSGMTYGPSLQPAHSVAFTKADPLNPAKTLAQMSQALADVPLAFHPGQYWAYGVSIDVVGRVVEVVSGEPLDEFFQTRIFKPLDMQDTGFFVPEEKHHRYATTYDSDGKGKLSPSDVTGRSNFAEPRACLSGGGGLVSTARDYMRFLMMIQQGGQLGGKRILSETSVRLMTTDQLPKNIPHIAFGAQKRVGIGFGFGFSVRKKMSEWDTPGRVGEYGWGGLASTHYWVSPKDELIVIALEQTLPYSFMTEFAIKGIVYDAIED